MKITNVFNKILLKVIFGTGDKLKAITLTANEGFVRSAAGQVYDIIIICYYGNTTNVSIIICI